MRHLIKQREIVIDDWRYAEEDPLGRKRALILPFNRWIRERKHWWLWDGRLGVRIASTDPAAVLAPDFLRVSLIAVKFDGTDEDRSCAQARMLRKLHGFTGELRAIGKIDCDQLSYLAHCGFDSFELPADVDLESALHAFDDFIPVYQAAIDVGGASAQHIG